MAIIVRHADKHIIEPARMNKKAGRAEVSGCRELRAEGGTPEAGRPELARAGPGRNGARARQGWAGAAGGQQEQGALVGRRRARAPGVETGLTAHQNRRGAPATVLIPRPIASPAPPKGSSAGLLRPGTETSAASRKGAMGRGCRQQGDGGGVGGGGVDLMPSSLSGLGT